MKKRWLSMVLAIALCLALSVPALDVSVDAATTITESQVIERLASAESVWPNGSVYVDQWDDGCGTCFGFIRELFYYIFGAHLPTSWAPARGRFSNNMTNITEIGRAENYSVNDLKGVLKQARPGDVLVATDGKNNHGLIVYSARSDGSGINVYDANWGKKNGKPAIRANTYWSAENIQEKKPLAVTLYRYKNYDGDSIVEETTPPPAPPAPSVQSYMTISGNNTPGTLQKGSSFYGTGTVTSNVTINWIWAGILDSSGNHVSEAQTNPGGYTYNISSLTSQLNFSGLFAGNYNYAVEAVGGDGNYYCLIEDTFEVVENKVENKYYLDVNGILDGVETGNVTGYGTFDVYINGSLVADDVSDYHTAWPSGTSYEIKDIKATRVCYFLSMGESVKSGTIGSRDTEVQLEFCVDYSAVSISVNVDQSTITVAWDSVPNCTAYDVTLFDDINVGRYSSGDISASTTNWVFRDVSDGNYFVVVDFKGKGSGKKSDKFTVKAQESHTHTLTYTPAKAATCTEPGNSAYWYCADCDKYFSDADAQNETTLADITLPALGHDFVDGVCTRDGVREAGYFTGSDVHFEPQTIYFQGQYSDVPANQWFSDSVASAFEFGLMKGNDDGTFNPYGDVTLAEAITMAARIHSIYATGSENFVQSGTWYQVYLDYALENAIISRAYYNSDVTHKATRAQFAEIFANSLPDEALAAMNAVADGAIPDVAVSDSFARYVYKLYRAGILTGGDANGTFSPQTYITRAESAAIVSRMAESDNRVSIALG